MALLYFLGASSLGSAIDIDSEKFNKDNNPYSNLLNELGVDLTFTLGSTENLINSDNQIADPTDNLTGPSGNFTNGIVDNKNSKFKIGDSGKGV